MKLGKIFCVPYCGGLGIKLLWCSIWVSAVCLLGTSDSFSEMLTRILLAGI